jgi:hypothetical protein
MSLHQVEPRQALVVGAHDADHGAIAVCVRINMASRAA